MKNKIMILISLLFFAFLFGCAQGPVQPKLMESMVALDRVYIPALLFTDLQRQRESELAIEGLKKEWDKFNKKYATLELKYGMDITDKFWQEDFAKIERLIVTAEGLVKKGDLSAANNKLAGVRLILKDLRHRHGFEYFLDGLTGFDNSMEGIISYLKGKDKLSDKEVAKLRSLFKEAQSNWSQAAATKVETELFGFKADKLAAVNKRVRDEEMMLASLAAALSGRNPDQIFQTAQDLKPNFIVLYKAFGDWQPIFDQVVKERKALDAKENKDKDKAK
ncbi:MAG: hypothetical protein KJ732_05190 [Candidatus Margulisbacteria bacterium]|nr:hypothetical protein [Candidatus Margulisiibacteriota bacterium]